jgi:hypothetical protein
MRMFRRSQCRRAVAATAGACALGMLAGMPARGADLEYPPPDRPYYPPHARVYPGPEEGPPPPYGYRPYGPAYRPHVWADPGDYYGDDDAYRYHHRYRYFRGPYAERPPAPVPYGPYAQDPRVVPPDADDMVAEDAPPPPRYGWRAPPRW